MTGTTSEPSGTQPPQGFLRVFAGLGAMSFLTYMAEYAAFFIVLVYLSDKFVVNFGLGDAGYAFVGTISGAFLIASGLVAIYMGHLSDKYGRRRMMIIGCLVGAAALPQDPSITAAQPKQWGRAKRAPCETHS